MLSAQQHSLFVLFIITAVLQSLQVFCHLCSKTQKSQDFCSNSNHIKTTNHAAFFSLWTKLYRLPSRLQQKHTFSHTKSLPCTPQQPKIWPPFHFPRDSPTTAPITNFHHPCQHILLSDYCFWMLILYLTLMFQPISSLFILHIATFLPKNVEQHFPLAFFKGMDPQLPQIQIEFLSEVFDLCLIAQSSSTSVKLSISVLKPASFSFLMEFWPVMCRLCVNLASGLPPNHVWGCRITFWGLWPMFDSSIFIY